MKIEMHTHTSEGSACAFDPAIKIVEAYAKTEAKGIVITNHYSKNTYERFKDDLKNNYLKGYHEAQSVSKQYGITIFLGMELNLIHNANDYLIYGIDEDFIERYPLIFSVSLSELKEIVHKENCLLIQAHPLRKECVLVETQYVDGYELNYTKFHDNHNDKLICWLKSIQETNSSIIVTYGSDCHGVLSVAGALMEFEEDIHSNSELVEAIRQNTIDDL